MTKKQQKQWLLDQIDLAILDVPGEYSIEGNHCVFRLPETTCVYKIWIEIADSVECRLNSLNRFKKQLNRQIVPNVGSPKLNIACQKITSIRQFIKDKEFDNAINAIALTDLHFGIGAANQNEKAIFYFPVKTATMWDRSVFITENDEIIDKLSGLRIGKKGIVLTLEQEIILSKAPDNYNKLLQELLS